MQQKSSKEIVSTTDVKVITPPARQFSNINEEILNLLGKSSTPLSLEEITNFLNIPYKSAQRSMYTILSSGETAEKHIRKRKKLDDNRINYYRFFSPTSLSSKQKDILFKTIVDDIKNIVTRRNRAKKVITQKTRSICKTSVKRMVIDVLNTYPTTSKFTINEFVQAYLDFYESDINSLGTIRTFISTFVKTGHITSERIPGKQYSQFTKILDIPYDILMKIPVKKDVVQKKEIRKFTGTEFNEKTKATVPLKLLKEMENTIKEQHSLIAKMKTKMAEIIDENTQLNTTSRRIKASHTDEVKRLNATLESQRTIPNYNFDLTKFRDELE